MKKVILSFTWLFLALPFLCAQTLPADPEEKPATILDELSRPEPGKGTVRIFQDPAIGRLIGSRLTNEHIEKNKDNDLAFLKMPGFRAQVFSGNNQRKSKEEALQKEKLIKEMYPDLPTYITYTAPFWKLRVGDFRSREEAYSLMRELKESFPEFAKEMYIVKDEVKIPL